MHHAILHRSLHLRNARTADHKPHDEYAGVTRKPQRYDDTGRATYLQLLAKDAASRRGGVRLETIDDDRMPRNDATGLCAKNLRLRSNVQGNRRVPSLPKDRRRTRVRLTAGLGGTRT